MKSTCRLLGKRTIVLTMFMAALAVPLCGQTNAKQSELTRQKSEVAAAEFQSEVGNTSARSNSSGESDPGHSQQDPTSTKPTTDTNTTQTKQPAQPYVFPTAQERFKRFLKNTAGPVRLGRTAISAGIDQWRDHPTEWGQGASGYGKRFASGLGKNAIRQTVTYGLDEAMDLDTGFKRSSRKRFVPRLKDALLENVTSRTRTGRRVFSVPKFAGVYAGSIIPAETWYPSRYSYKDGLRSGTRSVATGFGINLIREFLIKW